MSSKKTVKTNTLYYIHDPMCSWCYAFKPVLQQLRLQLKKSYPDNLQLVSLLGGLAIDTDAAMPAEMRQQLHATWQRIEQKVPTIQFNYAFWDNWQHTQPRRSTYPACRAVIAAHSFDSSSEKKYEELMVDSIQKAYYQQALNPSDNNVLIELATQIGLPKKEFEELLLDKDTQQTLEQQLDQCQKMNVRSYPSLILKIDTSYWPISIDYHNSDSILENIALLIDFED